MAIVLAIGSIFAVLTAHPPMPAAKSAPPPVNQSNAVNVFAEFNVTPYCTLSGPPSGLLNFGSASGNTPAGTLFVAGVQLSYFCDLGSHGGTPLLAIADAFSSGTPIYRMTGINRSATIDYQLCPAGSYGGFGSCSSNYIDSLSPSVALPLNPTSTVIPIVGYFFTQTSPLVVDNYGDDLTAVIYF